jgi:hypothetical protein
MVKLLDNCIGMTRAACEAFVYVVPQRGSS